MKIELDVHTHTLASGHAYGTITEMAQAAADKGLKLLGITEHASGIPGTCDDIYFMNLKVVPRQIAGIEVMLGVEVNILDYNGNLSMDEKLMNGLDLRIAGIHEFCYHFGTARENTNAIVNAIKNPYIDIISHPDDGNCQLIYEEVVEAAKKYHTLLEVNNNALRSIGSRKNVTENAITYLNLCKEYEVPVILSSDAHYMTDIANLDHVTPVIEQVDFPDELIMNYSVDRFKSFIQYKR